MDLLKNLQNLALSDDKNTSDHHASPPATAPPKHDSVLNKLSDALNKSHPTPPPPSVAHPAPAPAKHDSVFDKIGDALSGSHSTPAPHPVATPAPAPPRHESVLGKLSGALTGDSHQPAPAPAPKKNEDIFSKIGDAISGRKTPPPPPKEQNVFDKLSHAISGQGEQPAKPQGLGDKINSAFGGGAKGEANEDTLDKAIDLFQEHVLKQGPQNNESAIEQAKDEKIASTIKNVLGHKK